MNKPELKLYKIIPEKRHIWLAWCHKLSTTLLSKATNTIHNEGLEFELFLEFQIKGDFYTLAMTLDGAQGVNETLPQDIEEMNTVHKKNIKECLVPVSDSDISISYFLR